MPRANQRTFTGRHMAAILVAFFGVVIVVNLINARCLSGAVDPIDLQIARKAMLNTASTGTLFVRWFERVLPLATAGSCQGLTPSTLLTLIDAGLQNPKLAAAGPQQDMTYLRGRVALAQHDPDTGLADFVSALDLLPYPGMALRAAATLGQHGYPEQGLRLLDHYQRIPQQVRPMSLNMAALHDRVLAWQNYWPHEIDQLRNELSIAAKVTSANTIRPTLHSTTTH